MPWTYSLPEGRERIDHRPILDRPIPPVGEVRYQHGPVKVIFHREGPPQFVAGNGNPLHQQPRKGRPNGSMVQESRICGTCGDRFTSAWAEMCAPCRYAAKKARQRVRYAEGKKA